MSLLLSYALAYVKKGWFVFPLQPKKKIPMAGTRGHHDASNDPDQIKRWWEKYPNANIGINCALSKIAALDVDVKDGKRGLESLKTLVGEKEYLLNTMKAVTWSGGFHFVYLGSVPDSISKLGLHLDVKSLSGYIVACPSYIEEGDGPNKKCGMYKWDIPEGHSKPLDCLPFPDEFRISDEQKSYDKQPTSTITHIGENRNKTLFDIASSYRGKGLNFTDIMHKLVKDNDALCSPPLAYREVLTIAKSASKQATNEEKERTSGKLQVTTASDIADEETEWLWPGRIAMGLMTAIVGPEDAGKTYFYCWLAAQLSIGAELPVSDGPFQCESLIYHGEDSPAHVRSRLEKCGADLTKIHLISQQVGKENVRQIYDFLKEHREVKLLVLDPVAVILNGVSENSDNEVRHALEPLKIMAQELGICVLFLRHTGKNSELKVKDRVLGAKAFISFPRTVLAFYENHVDKKRAIFNVKNNLGDKSDPILYSISDRGFLIGEEDDSLDVEAFSVSKSDPNAPKTKVRSEDVVAWMLGTLSEGPMSAAVLFQKAAVNGFSEKAVRRNRDKAGVKTEKQGMGAGWYWFLPKMPNAEDARFSAHPAKRASSGGASPLGYSKNPVVTEEGHGIETGIFEDAQIQERASSKMPKVLKNPVVIEDDHKYILRKETDYDFSPNADNGVKSLISYVDDVFGEFPMEGEVAL